MRERMAITAMRLAFHGTDQDVRDHAARKAGHEAQGGEDQTAAALAAFGLQEVSA